MTVPSVQPVVPTGFDSFGRWFERTFRAFGENWGVWVLQSLIYVAAMVLIVAMAIGVYILAFGFPMLMELLRSEGNAVTTSPSISPADLRLIFGILLITVLLACVTAAYLITGMYLTAIKQLRGQPIAVTDVFSAGPAFWPYIVTSIFKGLLIAISALACLVPAIFVWPLFALAIPIVLDRRLRAEASLSLSYDLVKRNYWLFWVYGFVFWLLGFAVQMVIRVFPPLGLLFPLIVTPISVLCFTVPYVDIFDGSAPVAGPSWSGVPPPYIPPTYTPGGISAPPTAPPAPGTDEPPASPTFTWKNPDAN